MVTAATYCAQFAPALTLPQNHAENFNPFKIPTAFCGQNEPIQIDVVVMSKHAHSSFSGNLVSILPPYWRVKRQIRLLQVTFSLLLL